MIASMQLKDRLNVEQTYTQAVVNGKGVYLKSGVSLAAPVFVSAQNSGSALGESRGTDRCLFSYKSIWTDTNTSSPTYGTKQGVTLNLSLTYGRGTVANDRAEAIAAIKDFINDAAAVDQWVNGLLS